jgi:hypothetical protein
VTVEELLGKGIRIEYLQPMTVLSSGYEGCDHLDPRFAEFVEDAMAMGLMAEPGMRRDFYFLNNSIKGYELVIAVSDGSSATPPYVVKAFPGGLYAIVSCTDDIPQKVELLVKSTDACDRLTADTSEDPFRSSILSHVVTPKSVQDALGVEQMDLFLPITLNTK